MGFTTYENRNNPHVAIHHDTCTQLCKNGGKGRGEYKKHTTFDQAEAYAKQTGLKLIYCSFCKPENA